MTIESLLREFSKISATRHNWDNLYQEISELVIPRKAEITIKVTGGDKKENKIYDSTPVYACEVAAASLHGMLVNYGAEWFSIESTDSKLNTMPDVRRWFSDVTSIMHSYIHDAASGFSTALDEVFLDLMAFGTACMVVKQDTITGVKFDSWSIGSFYIAEGRDGEVDTVYSRHEMTAHEIISKFKEADDNIPTDIIKAASEDPYTKHEIIYCVKPREGYKEGLVSKKFKRYAEYWIHPQSISYLREGGFDNFPFMTPRWRKDAGEIYGYSPAMQVLADIKTLNVMQKAVIFASELSLAPPLQVPHDTFLGTIKNFPNAINYYNRMASERIEPLVTVGNIPITLDMINSLRSNILRGFYNDQLQLAERPNMTATEVQQRTSEKLRLMSPMLGRVQSELLSKMLSNVFYILYQNQAFSEIPNELKGSNFKIRYLSQLARAQSANKVEKILQTAGIVAQLAQIDPEVLDRFNMPEAAEIAAIDIGFPAEAQRTDDEVAMIQQNRAQQQQAIMQQQNTMMQAEVINKTAGVMKQ